ncbi:hypothetical protein CVT26_008087 [Gymnopilus dilepis]|uniref:Uncharacterized protein n=1 Tax=Gymnopilus dilepis TaxID=231916 RepID=A0A409YJN3_9AGAR|nr:hypothetical protein CVT26_008087 [Gymnopilus dilepis]
MTRMHIPCLDRLPLPSTLKNASQAQPLSIPSPLLGYSCSQSSNARYLPRMPRPADAPFKFERSGAPLLQEWEFGALRSPFHQAFNGLQLLSLLETMVPHLSFAFAHGHPIPLPLPLRDNPDVPPPPEPAVTSVKSQQCGSPHLHFLAFSWTPTALYPALIFNCQQPRADFQLSTALLSLVTPPDKLSLLQKCSNWSKEQNYKSDCENIKF